MKTFNLYKYLNGDRVIWNIIFALSIFSALAVYSSTGTLAFARQGGNYFYYGLKHGMLLLVGIAIVYFVHNINYKVYFRLAKLLFLLTIPLLLLTLLMGVNLNSASRWMTIPGIGLTFQTSDFAKLSIIIYVAYILSKNQNDVKDFKKTMKPVLLASGLICGLILPANFSTAALLFSVTIVMMFIGRVSLKNMAILFAAAVLLIFMLGVVIFKFPQVVPRGQTWQNRIENYIGKGSGDSFQADQAKIAIATGKIFGKMPGNSEQRNFLPHPYSDFIFAIIIEEYGLIGGIIIILLYLTLLYRSGMIARNSEYTFPALLATGLTFSLVFQALINMAVAVNLLPVTGQTLPMVSMGGTSILFTSMSLGIILNVSKNIKAKNNSDINESSDTMQDNQ